MVEVTYRDLRGGLRGGEGRLVGGAGRVRAGSAGSGSGRWVVTKPDRDRVARRLDRVGVVVGMIAFRRVAAGVLAIEMAFDCGGDW